MTIYYLDTSALVKYYVTEPGSVWVRQSLLNAAQAEGLKVENPFWHTDPSAPRTPGKRFAFISKYEYNG